MCRRASRSAIVSTAGKASKPAKPLSAYNCFFHEERQRIQDDLIQQTGKKPNFTYVTKVVASRWRKLSQEDKLHYDQLAVKDKRRYALEMIQWKLQQEKTSEDGEQTCQQVDASGSDSDSRVSKEETLEMNKKRASPAPSVVSHSSTECDFGQARQYRAPSFTRSAHYMVHPSMCGEDEPSLVEKLNFLLQVGMKETLMHMQRTALEQIEPIEAYTEQRLNFDEDDVHFLEETFGIGHCH